MESNVNESTHAVEQWKPIPGWDGFYEVSDLGRVRSVDRVVPRGNHTRLFRGRIVAQNPNQSGYPTVRLSREGQPFTMKVHSLVTEAFLGVRPEGMIVCHGDDDRTNNRLSNLRYGTWSDNQYDAVRNRRHYRGSQTHCKRGHLLEAPNLVSNHPTRMCFACRKAVAKVKHAESRNIRLDYQAVADEQYALIMKE